MAAPLLEMSGGLEAAAEVPVSAEPAQDLLEADAFDQPDQLVANAPQADAFDEPDQLAVVAKAEEPAAGGDAFDEPDQLVSVVKDANPPTPPPVVPDVPDSL